MPELPEIRTIARQMQEELLSDSILSAAISQPKCLNLPFEVWKQYVSGRRIDGVEAKGKWILVHMAEGYDLRINLGMGGEVLLHETGDPFPERRRALLDLSSGRRISVNFWWFGSLHAIAPGEAHPPFDKLGIDILAVDAETFFRTYSGKKSPIKTLLLKQELLCGVGNYYVHDILFHAGIHPSRPGNSLTREETARLHAAVHEIFSLAIAQGASDYERDFYNCLGHYSATQVGYREGQPCRICGETILSQRIGSANSYFCPRCQATEIDEKITGNKFRT